MTQETKDDFLQNRCLIHGSSSKRKKSFAKTKLQFLGDKFETWRHITQNRWFFLWAAAGIFFMMFEVISHFSSKLQVEIIMVEKC